MVLSAETQYIDPQVPLCPTPTVSVTHTTPMPIHQIERAGTKNHGKKISVNFGYINASRIYHPFSTQQFLSRQDF
jgi:hypothetical protein